MDWETSYESRLHTGDLADVAGAAHYRFELLAGLGPAADAHGGSFRRQLAAERLYLAGRRAVPGPRDHGDDAHFIHGHCVDRADDEAERVMASPDGCLRDSGFLLVRQPFHRELQFERTAGPFRVGGPELPGNQ